MVRAEDKCRALLDSWLGGFCDSQLIRHAFWVLGARVVYSADTCLLQELYRNWREARTRTLNSWFENMLEVKTELS